MPFTTVRRHVRQRSVAKAARLCASEGHVRPPNRLFELGFKYMKTESFAVGDKLKMMCSACDSDQEHTVAKATKLGKISSAVCDACGTASTFSRGVKTSIALGGSKAAAPYDRTRKYRKGQAMLHSVFGQGEVTEVVDVGKIDVLFGDRTRRLIHAQEAQEGLAK